MRSDTAAAAWGEQVVMRKRAMEPIKAALRRNGQAQTWLLAEVNRQRGITAMNQPLWYAYLNGHARVPQAVLSAACRIAGVRESDITRRIDLDVLLQVKGVKGKKKRARK